MPLDGDTKFKDLKKNYGAGRELRGKTLGIIGFGRIGREVAKIALGCGMKVIASDRNVGEADITLDFYDGQKITLKIKTEPVSELIKHSDFITLTCAFTIRLFNWKRRNFKNEGWRGYY